MMWAQIISQGNEFDSDLVCHLFSVHHSWNACCLMFDDDDDDDDQDGDDDDDDDDDASTKQQ